MKTTKIFTIIAALMMAATTFAQSGSTDSGVVINGVKWATRNVDAPGTFADTPQAAGMFYQWNRNIGWSATDPMVNSKGGTTWDNTDPSPAGWRVPTLAELQTLLDASKVSSEWTTQDEVNGRLFTDNTTNATLFLPAAGIRFNNDGSLAAAGEEGDYWSSTQNNYSNAFNLYTYSGGVQGSNSGRAFGLSVRPVSTSTTALADVQTAAPLRIFPNPAKDFVTIDGIQAGETVTISDLQGRVVMSVGALRATPLQNGTQTINVSTLPQGVYLLKIGNNVQKFIKQ